jgi:integrase
MGRTKAVGNGEGSIVTIKRKGKIVGYAPEISLGFVDGKRKRKRGDSYKTRGEARTALAELKGQHESGVDLLAKAPKVKDYFPAWLKDFARKGRPKSVETYRWAIDKVIIPQLGDISLKKLTTMRLDGWFAQLLDGSADCKPRAAASVGLVRTVLLQGFKQAKKWGLVTVNPVLETTPPTIGPSRTKVLTNDQAAAFLEMAQGDPLELALRLLLALGLRRGEVCGLRWSDIDLERGTLTVNGTLQYIHGHGLLYGPPKTESGRRGFTLPTWHC